MAKRIFRFCTACPTTTAMDAPEREGIGGVRQLSGREHAAVASGGKPDQLSFAGQRVNPSFSGSHYDHHAMMSNTYERVSKAPQFYPAATQLTSSVQTASQKLPAGFEPQRGRATSPHAGPDRGFMFMPEVVGDEVAVAFEDGDPERPVILGALWNGLHQQPRYVHAVLIKTIQGSPQKTDNRAR